MTGMSKKIKTQTWSGFLFTQTSATNYQISVTVEGKYIEHLFLSLLTSWGQMCQNHWKESSWVESARNRWTPWLGRLNLAVESMQYAPLVHCSYARARGVNVKLRLSGMLLAV